MTATAMTFRACPSGAMLGAAGLGRGFALPDRRAAVAVAVPERIRSMNQPRHRARPAVLAIAAVLVALAPSAQARNVRLMESVPDAIRGTRTHDILGTLDLRFGSDSAKGAQIVRRDVVVKGVGSTKVDDVGEDDRVRPRDHELCARAFEDAMTKLAFAARGARGTAIVGVISNYEGSVFDDPVHYECHVGALKAAVTLRAQIATGTVAPAPSDVPVLSPPQPATPPAPVVAPPRGDLVPPPPPPTFQPLPPAPAPAPAPN